jgi:glyoxylase-like metal-dependent hydrolase (beta-lactamase superfamily II)
MKKYLSLSLVSFLLSVPGHKAEAQETVLTYRIGDVQVSILSEGERQGDRALLVNITPGIVEKLLPKGVFPLQTQAFLVRTPDKNILIDAGFGKNLFENLRTLQVAEDQIGVILLTHLHGDHIGGLLRNGEKAFPKAELYLSQAEYDYWMGAKERGADARKALEAYSDRLHLFTPGDPDSKALDLFPGVTPIAAYGHTPGHTAYLITSAGERLLIWGDVAHAMEVQMPHPEVALTFDHDRDQAILTRKKILDYVCRHKIGIAGAHIQMPAIGNVTARKAGEYTFTPRCTCEAI